MENVIGSNSGEAMFLVSNSRDGFHGVGVTAAKESPEMPWRNRLYECMGKIAFMQFDSEEALKDYERSFREKAGALGVSLKQLWPPLGDTIQRWK